MNFLAWPYYCIKNIEFWIRTASKLSFFIIHRKVKFIGARGLHIGKNSKIGDGSWININDPKIGNLYIGRNCLIGQNNFITVGGDIKIGNYFLSGGNCAIISSSHHISDPSLPYLKTGTTSNQRITIGNNVFIGYNVTIIGDLSIGDGSVIGAGSFVTKSIPPLSMAVGNPARIIKQYSMSEKKWIPVKDGDQNLTDNTSNFKITEFLNFIQPLPALRKKYNVY